MILVSFLSFLSFLSVASADDTRYGLYNNCSNTNFTRNSIYQSNLNVLLSSLASNASRNNGFLNGFYNTTAGEDPDKVYALFLCRGDVSMSTCQDCVTSAARDVTERCPNQKGTIIWFDMCLLRYSDEYFFSAMDTEPVFLLYNIQNGMESFDQLVYSSMDTTLDDALNVPKLFATREYDIGGWGTLYSLVQCTPDLSRDDCSLCVQQAISEMQKYSTLIKIGGRVLSPSCTIRYELYPFYNEAPALLPAPVPLPENTPEFVSPNTTGEGGKGRGTTWIAIGTTISAIIILFLLGSFLWYMRRRNKRGKCNHSNKHDNNKIYFASLAPLFRLTNALSRVEENANYQEVQLLGIGEGRIGRDYSYDILREEQQLESQELPLFPLGLTLEATQNFSDENKLGEGGFGPVYKGVLVNGMEIAVKRLSRTSGQGLQEFQNEVTLIAKLQHKNLVRLLGCCLERNELLLIYEYMPNKSLDFLLFGLPPKPSYPS